MNKNICIARHTCRICGSPDLHPVLNLGNQYIASIFVEGQVPSFLLQPYPLEVVRCTASDGCGLVQLRHTISPDVLYAYYGYRSGTNEIMRANLRDIAAKVEQMIELKNGDVVLDIGCNDGTLLDSYQTAGVDKLGFDPAVNVVATAREKGLEVVDDFFSSESFARVRPGRKAKVVTSIAMFYDLEDPCRFVRDVASLLADDGVWVIELSYLPFMLQKNLFDAICHEHLEYYALRPIEWMLQPEQLQVHKIEFNDINGGSFRLFIRKRAAGPVPEDTRVLLDKVRRDEEILGLDTDRPYTLFREAALKVRDDLMSLLVDLKAAGKSVYIYGASTKGNTILQFCGIDQTMIVKAADRNPEKWGRRTLGTDIPIASEEEVRAEKPDYFLVLPWHFFEVFKKREEAFLKRGGKFILPLPEVRVVGLDSLMIIPEDLYSQVRRVMPISCVDLLVSDDSGHVLLIKRNNEPAKGQWWFPGGRVHYKETRATAAVRKLREECGLEVVGMEELGTYDVILDMPSNNSPSHGITTLFHMRVRKHGTFRLDDQSVAADWRAPQEWQKEHLHPFVSEGLSFLLDDSRKVKPRGA